MRMTDQRDSSTRGVKLHDSRIQRIVEFWNDVGFRDDAGATTWDVLRSLERVVSESLMNSPPNLPKADAVTARAARLLDGELN